MPMNRRHSLEGEAAAPSLKPYLAVVTLVVVLVVVGLAVVDRWGPRESSDEELSPGAIEGAGRVVIGPRSATNPKSNHPPQPDHVYKTDEFTFYKSLGNAATPEPKLAPLPPPRPVRSDRRDVAPEKDLFASATEGKAQPKRYTVQVGSFHDKKSADWLAVRLRRRHQGVAVSRVILPDTGVRYRVRVGEFKTRQEALALADRLKTKEKLNPFVASITEGS